jgi:DNA-binding transcriptional regulator YiaG
MPAPRNREQFVALVNDARRRQYLSIRAVARIAQVPPTTVQGWLDGRHFPSPALRGNYLRLVHHLGLGDQVPESIWDDSRTGANGVRR